MPTVEEIRALVAAHDSGAVYAHVGTEIENYRALLAAYDAVVKERDAAPTWSGTLLLARVERVEELREVLRFIESCPGGTSAGAVLRWVEKRIAELEAT